MIKSEINEIKKLFHKDASVISKFSTCYVDHEKNIKLLSTKSYSLIPEEDSFKYEDMFKKTLSGTVGKQLLNIDIELEEELNGLSHKLLMELMIYPLRQRIRWDLMMPLRKLIMPYFAVYVL